MRVSERRARARNSLAGFPRMRARMNYLADTLSPRELKAQVEKITVVPSKLDTVSCKRFIRHRL